MRARLWIALIAGLLWGGLSPVAAAAVGNALIRVETAYAAGGIPACKFTGTELQAAQSEIPTDVAQYDADLVNAIHQALSAQASGACSKAAPSGSNPGGLVPGGSVNAGGGAARIPAVALGSATQAGIPAPLVGLWVATLLALVLGACWWLGWLLGWEPLRAWHGWRETGFRLSGAWSALGERLRGR
jgi:hypothetical protein